MNMETNEVKCIKLVKAQNIDQLHIFSAKNKDFNFSFTDENGNTLLHYAVEVQTEKTQAILKWLVGEGIDIQSVNKNFETPLEVAKKYKNIPAMSYLNMLLDKEQ